MEESTNVENESIYGAFAAVHIKFGGGLKQLADKLASDLGLKYLDVEACESPPYELIGSLETLGWEGWLEASSGNPPYNFHLRIETEDTFTESFEGRMHDLSPWFARLLTRCFDIEAIPERLSPPLE